MLAMEEGKAVQLVLDLVSYVLRIFQDGGTESLARANTSALPRWSPGALEKLDYNLLIAILRR